MCRSADMLLESGGSSIDVIYTDLEKAFDKVPIADLLVSYIV